MNSAPEPQRPPPSAPSALHEHAEDNLRFIRATMESATSFTGISGKGYLLAGSTSLIAAWLASRQVSPGGWLAVWMIELVLAANVMLVLTAIKASAQGRPLWSGNGIRLLGAFAPPMIAGGLLTLALFLQASIELLPGIWLSLYGAAVMTAGAHSIRIIPMMGAVFMAIGAVALLFPATGNLMLGLGMGGLHLVLGVIVWRQYGG